MKEIKVLGTGCANCKATTKLIEEMAADKGVSITLEKVEDIAEITGYGVMSTPGVVVDGKVVHAGGIPAKAAIDAWLEERDAVSSRSGNGASTGSGCCS